jgi:hypothetical protein
MQACIAQPSLNKCRLSLKVKGARKYNNWQQFPLPSNAKVWICKTFIFIFGYYDDDQKNTI